MRAPSNGMTAISYGGILEANDRVNFSVVGNSGRFRGSLRKAFLKHKNAINVDFAGVTDIWNKRRDESQAALSKDVGHQVKAFSNNEELFEDDKKDAAIISAADFQHVLHAAEADEAGLDGQLYKIIAWHIKSTALVYGFTSSKACSCRRSVLSMVRWM